MKNDLATFLMVVAIFMVAYLAVNSVISIPFETKGDTQSARILIERFQHQ